MESSSGPLRFVKTRRRFLSAAAFGTLGLRPMILTEPPRLVSDDFVPNVADSLEQYTERVRRLRPAFNRPPLDVAFSIAIDVERLSRYFQSTRDPAGRKFSPDKWSNKIEELITKGATGVKLLADQSKRDLQAAAAELDSLRLIASYLEDLTRLVKDSAFVQAFEQRARTTISDLVQDINNTSQLVQYSIYNLQALDIHIEAVRLYLLIAQQDFQLGNLNSAQASVMKAKAELSGFNVNPLNDVQRIELTRFNSLLDGCINWIKKGGVFNEPGIRHHVRSYVAAGLVSTVSQVLRDILPERSALRVGSCVALITPILFLSADPKDRFDPISSVLTSLYPSGKNDNDEVSRKSAADRLSKIDL